MWRKANICVLVLLGSFLVAMHVAAQDLELSPGFRKSSEPMSAAQAALLGVVEGITEYLPVSSTGHLLLAQRLMGIGESEGEKHAADAYVIFIQGGAIIAVLILYRKRFLSMLEGCFGKNREGKKLIGNMICAFIPAAVLGLLFERQIKAYWFGMWPVVFAWFVGGVVILLADKRLLTKATEAGITLEHLTYRKALIIGFLQCVAMWPGVSRSLVTILGGLIAGLNMVAAIEFSFLLGVVTLGSAAAYEVVSSGELMAAQFSLVNAALGFVAAFIAAVLAIKWMLAYLNRHGLSVFGYYRILLAVIITIVLLSGML